MSKRSDCEASSDRAKARWKLLSQALKKQKNVVNNELHSVRRFPGFNLFDVKKLVHDTSEKHDWFLYTLRDNSEDLGSIQGVKIRLLKDTTSAIDLIGFNNTGNVCVWPSEEILAYYCFENKILFKGKSVCELGGGMTGLAAMQIARNFDCQKILLTDGNEVSVDNMKCILEKNVSSFNTNNVKCSVLRWGENLTQLVESHGKYDIILCADCLFFVEAHNCLVKTINDIMNKNGMCIIFAPCRSGTLETFVQLAKKTFFVTVSDRYNEYIWGLHQKCMGSQVYSSDLNYSFMLTLKHLPVDS